MTLTVFVAGFARQCLSYLLLLLATSACGEVYRWQDEGGKTHFSDRPVPGAETLRIAPPPPEAAGLLRVDKVYDGDTVSLENGEKVRLLAINTPEVGGAHGREEAGGQDAKVWLKHHLEGRRVRLETDVELRDHYHRLLAHLFLPDGEHVNRRLVELGYAVVILHPPNLRYADELLAAQAIAERERRGVWARPEYQPKVLLGTDLGALSGWQRLIGRVMAVEKNRHFWILRFAGGLAAHIPKAQAQRFPPIENYLDQTLEVRGWLTRRGGDYVIHVNHPSALLKR